MNGRCRVVQEALEGLGGQDPEVTAHLAECPVCRAHARLLAVLARVEPASDEDAAAHVLATLPLAAWQLRRFATWAPVVAGVGLVGAGLALVGGVPASASWSAMAGGAGETLAWSLSRAVDAVAAARASSVALRALLAAGGAGIVLWLVVAGAGSGLAVLTLARRRGPRS